MLVEVYNSGHLDYAALVGLEPTLRDYQEEDNLTLENLEDR
jgi:hypothetical protein